MEAVWSFLDSLPAWGVLGLIGLLFIALTFILDVISDVREEWR